jgi:eukaryotic-like serine/threonine-protein kinase
VVATAENAEGEIPPGSVVLGRYQVLGKLAQGGMAEVYLARQVGPGGYQKLVVTKRVRPHLSKDDDFVGMFVNEARLAAMINHPNVVQIFDLGEEPSVDVSNAGGSDWFLAMEYLDGRDMLQVGRACRSHNKAVPFDVTARIIADACAGLEHAHNLKGADGQSLDLVHRDMSPENIIITFEGQVKVVDFGIAKAADNSIRTQAGQIKGKLGYVAPEAILGKPVDGRADIFAVGATLYLFLSGRPAFTGTSPMEIFERSLKPPPSPQEVNPRVPPALDEICMKALAQDRDKRYRTAGEVRAALDSYLTSTGRPLGAPQLSQFMRILFPPDKDPVRQRIDKLLLDAQSFPAPKRANAPRTISVPQVPAVTLSQVGGAVSDRERTVVAVDAERAVPTQAPRAVEIGPSPQGPNTQSLHAPTQKAARIGPAHLRSVGVSDEIPDLSNPRARMPEAPESEDKTELTGRLPSDPGRRGVTAESPERGAPDRVDEPTLGVDVEISMELDQQVADQMTAEHEHPTAERRAVADALAEDDSELDGPVTLRSSIEELPIPAQSDSGYSKTVPASASPYQSGQTLSGRSPETGFPQGTELPPPFEGSLPGVASPERSDDGAALGATAEPSLEAPLFAPPSGELARDELEEMAPAAALADGPVPMSWKVGMAALGVASGVLLLWVGLAITGHTSLLFGP